MAGLLGGLLGIGSQIIGAISNGIGKNGGGGGDKNANNDPAQAAQGGQAAAPAGGGGESDSIKGKDAENTASDTMNTMYNTFMSANSIQDVQQKAQQLMGKIQECKLKNKDELIQYIQNYAQQFTTWMQQGGVPTGAQGAAQGAAQGVAQGAAQGPGAGPQAGVDPAVANAIPGLGIYAQAEQQGLQAAQSPLARALQGV